MKRENNALETYKNLHENRTRLANEELRKINESVAKKDQFMHDYHVIRDMRARKEMTHSKLMEAARNDALATVIKAIYITAMEAEAMTDQGILLAENMVDKWIAERGGASNILSKTGNNTYLLSRITQIVEDAAVASVDEIENDNSEDEVPDESTSKDVQIAQLTAKDAEIKAQIANLKAEKKAEEESNKTESDNNSEVDNTNVEETPAEETESEETPADTSTDESDNKEDTDEAPAEDAEKSEETTEDDEESEESTDDAEEHDEESEEVDDTEEPDEENEIEIEDDEEETTDNIFDELEQEEDIQKAIEIIRNRVANAEEIFIKNNAENKKKIDELLNKISANIKTVEDMAEKDPSKAKIANEAVMENKKKINSIRTERVFTIFDKMANILTENIIKNDNVRDTYMTEGSLDIDLVIESAKVMYGFLETLNTIQIEKVDSKYIQKVINEMK